MITLSDYQHITMSASISSNSKFALTLRLRLGFGGSWGSAGLLSEGSRTPLSFRLPRNNKSALLAGLGIASGQKGVGQDSTVHRRGKIGTATVHLFNAARWFAAAEFGGPSHLASFRTTRFLSRAHNQSKQPQ
jgi:hypothetical protein